MGYLNMAKNVMGFTVEINSAAVAGQTIFHVHMHLAPKIEGDVIDPRVGPEILY